MTLALHHLALRTRDLERLATFYRETIGLRERQRHHHLDGALRSIWFDAASVVIMIEHAAATEPLPPPDSLELVAFAIEPGGIQSWRERFAAAGIAIEAQTAFTLYVRDPDGRRVAVSTLKFQ